MMINIEKCGSCTAICGLIEKGLGEKAINAIAKAGNFDDDARCNSGPEVMEGGWTHCGAPERVQGALEGANAVLDVGIVAVEHSQDNLVTV